MNTIEEIVTKIKNSELLSEEEVGLFAVEILESIKKDEILIKSIDSDHFWNLMEKHEIKSVCYWNLLCENIPIENIQRISSLIHKELIEFCKSFPKPKCGAE